MLTMLSNSTHFQWLDMGGNSGTHQWYGIFLQYNNPSIPNLLEVIFSVKTGVIPGQFQQTWFSTSQSLLKRRAMQNQEMLSTEVWRCNFSSSCSLQHNFSTWIICKACQRKWQRDRGRHFWASPWPKAKPCGWFCSYQIHWAGPVCQVRSHLTAMVWGQHGGMLVSNDSSKCWYTFMRMSCTQMILILDVESDYMRNQCRHPFPLNFQCLP